MCARHYSLHGAADPTILDGLSTNPSLAGSWLLGTSGARSLGTPLADIEGPTYLGPRQPVTAQCCHFDSVNFNARSCEFFPLGAGVTQAGAHPLPHEVAFKLRDGRHESKMA
jgi:hypothetical protein